MGWRRPFAMAALLATLCAPFAMPAAAQAGWVYRFALDGTDYSISMGDPHPWFPRWPIDPGPLRSIDISRITPELNKLVHGEATHLIVTDSLGRSALVIDLKRGVAIDLNQNLAR